MSVFLVLWTGIVFVALLGILIHSGDETLYRGCFYIDRILLQLLISEGKLTVQKCDRLFDGKHVC